MVLMKSGKSWRSIFLSLSLYFFINFFFHFLLSFLFLYPLLKQWFVLTLDFSFSGGIWSSPSNGQWTFSNYCLGGLWRLVTSQVSHANVINLLQYSARALPKTSRLHICRTTSPSCSSHCTNFYPVSQTWNQTKAENSWRDVPRGSFQLHRDTPVMSWWVMHMLDMFQAWHLQSAAALYYWIQLGWIICKYNKWGSSAGTWSNLWHWYSLKRQWWTIIEKSCSWNSHILGVDCFLCRSIWILKADQF